VILTITFPRRSRSPPPGNLRFRPYPVEQISHSPADTQNTSLLELCARVFISELPLRKGKRNTDDPSFFPIGSSYSTPTHVPGENLVLPTNRTVPRLWKPGSVDSTWHLEPTWTLTSSSVFCGSSGFSAKRPSFWRCLCARTVSTGESLRERCEGAWGSGYHYAVRKLLRSARTFRLGKRR
jgi:hypothetical protein